MFARHYCQLLAERMGAPAKLLSLDALPPDFMHPDMFSHPTPSLLAIQDAYLLHAEKFVFVLPEYNGGMPGILKLFLDACSVRQAKETFFGKKAALLGISDGRAGNLRGMEHLSGILNYLGVIVLPNKQPISSVGKLLDEHRNITDPETLAVMARQADQLIAL